MYYNTKHDAYTFIQGIVPRLHLRNTTNYMLCLKWQWHRKLPRREPPSILHMKSSREKFVRLPNLKTTESYWRPNVERYSFIYRDIMAYLSPFRKDLFLLSITTICSLISLLQLVSLLGQFSSIITKGFNSQLLSDSGRLLLFLLLRCCFLFLQDTILAKVVTEFQYSLRSDLVRNLVYLDLVFHNQVENGELLYITISAVDQVGKLVFVLFHSILPGVVQFLGIFLYMILISPLLTCSLIVTVPLMLLVYNKLEKLLVHTMKKVQETLTDFSSNFSDTLRNIRIIQSYAAESYILKYKLNKMMQQAKKESYHSERLKAAIIPLITLLYALSVMILLLLSAYLMGTGILSSSSLVSFVSSVAFLMEPLQVLASNSVELRGGELAWQQVKKHLHASSMVQDNGTYEPSSVEGHVEFRNVSFSYNRMKTEGGNECSTLSNIELKVSAGHSVALIGLSGSGKTTLLSLLSRFYDPSSGSILLDGVDIRNMKLRALRKLVGVVPQETSLISGTIVENIALGDINVDMARVHYAAEVANATEFIYKLNDGFNYEVGDGGCRLSGGQRQRISIARAVYSNAPILVFDEATSSLDSESEEAIQLAVDNMKRSHTLFIIAHRLSTIQSVDTIVVLEQGKILESGTPQELLEKDGRYTEFLKRQRIQDKKEVHQYL
eukprot:jgi/Galph1/4944/GphlegSOOS_G3677.1